MKLCFYGPESDHQNIIDLLHQLPQCRARVSSWENHPDYDSFVDSLVCGSFDAVFITENNANGMEGVIASRNVCPNMPVIWFSNDEGFGCQAYRLNAHFFHAKPVTAPILEMALSRLPNNT